jgi:hypothetical protein
MLVADVNKLYELQGEQTDTEFAKELGISRTQLWRIKNRRSAIGATFIMKFKDRYPGENTDDYFITSDGPLKEQ